MRTSLSSGRSLTFYQQTAVKRPNLNTLHTGGLTTVPVSQLSHATAVITTGYNDQLTNHITRLNTLRAGDIERYGGSIFAPNSSARNMGVKRAWMYEKADIQMGGKGSANWTADEQRQIIEHGTVRGAQGHHQQNVSDHPEQQANPDNIKFYKTRKDHLQQGHDGNWDNESNKPMADKNEMLKKTNSKRVLKNEVYGLALAAAIGTGVGFTLGFVTSLAQSGISPDTLKYAAIEGTKGGAEGGFLTAISYGLSRTLGEVATTAISGVLGKFVTTVTENITKMVNMGVAGVLTIAVFATYQFIKLKIKGEATKEALIHVGKQALFSLSILAVSIAAQGIWGGAAGLIVSISVGIIIVSYSIVDSVHQRHFAERIRTYTIEKCYPSFALM